MHDCDSKLKYTSGALGGHGKYRRMRALEHLNRIWRSTLRNSKNKAVSKGSTSKPFLSHFVVPWGQAGALVYRLSILSVFPWCILCPSSEKGKIVQTSRKEKGVSTKSRLSAIAYELRGCHLSADQVGARGGHWSSRWSAQVSRGGADRGLDVGPRGLYYGPGLSVSASVGFPACFCS